MTDTPTKRAQHDEHRQIGDYRVKNWLGEGVNGAVRLGINVKTKQKVALKFMSKVGTQGKQQERLLREMRLLSLLHHPNVVALYEIIETPDYYIMVLERVRKGELLAYITDHGCLSETKFRPIFRSILSAIDYCHQNSVVHRDLKPENILLNDGNEVKVIDFGLSNMFDNVTFLDTYCGSPKYAAPEIISGTRYLGPTVDVWSIGVIFYAALVGRLPFPGRTVEISYNRMLSGVIEIPSFLSPEARDFIQRILIVDVRGRMTMAQAMRHPWVTMGYDGPPDSFVPPRPPIVTDCSSEDFEVIKSYGFAPKDIHAAFANPNPNPIKSLYFLHVEKQQREASRQRENDANKGAKSLISRVKRSIKGTLRIRRPDDDRSTILDVSYLSGRLVIMGYPTPHSSSDEYDRIDEVCDFLDRHHGQNYFVWGFAPVACHLPSDAFHGRLRQFATDKRGMPAVETLRTFCDHAVEWVRSNDRHIVAVFGKDTLSASVAAMVALQLHLRFSPSPPPARAHIDSIVEATLARIHDPPLASPSSSRTSVNRSGLGLVSPSARRLIDYCMTLRSMGDEMPPVVLGLTSLNVTRTPAFDVSGGCDPIVKVQTNDITILKTRPVRHFSARKDVGFSLKCETVPLSGLVHVQLLDYDRLGNERIGGFYFHPSLVDNCHNLVTAAPPRSRSMPADIAAIAAGRFDMERDSSSTVGGSSLLDTLRVSSASLGLRLMGRQSQTSLSELSTLASNSRPSSRAGSRPGSRPGSRAPSPAFAERRPVLRRLAFTLKKEDLDLDKPDCFPDNGEIVVHLYQPALSDEEVEEDE